MARPALKRQAVDYVVDHYAIARRRACRIAARVNVVAACSYAAAAFTLAATISMSTTDSFSGLSVTATMGSQLRV
jgi:hypothetical protein